MSMLVKDFERIYLILQLFTDGHASLWTVAEKLRCVSKWLVCTLVCLVVTSGVWRICSGFRRSKPLTLCRPLYALGLDACL
jgi:hypothetical protein